MIHWISEKLACSLVEIVGSATPTIVTSSSSMKVELSTTASVHHLRLPDSPVSSSGDFASAWPTLVNCIGCLRSATPSNTGEVSWIVASPIWIWSPGASVYGSRIRSPLT